MGRAKRVLRKFELSSRRFTSPALLPSCPHLFPNVNDHSLCRFVMVDNNGIVLVGKSFDTVLLNAVSACYLLALVPHSCAPSAQPPVPSPSPLHTLTPTRPSLPSPTPPPFRGPVVTGEAASDRSTAAFCSRFSGQL